MRFSKLREFGNDFMVVDAVTQLAYFSPELIRRLANRIRGVGFTQLILIEPPYVPEMDFYCRIFDIEGNEVKNDIEGGFAIAEFIRQTELSAKSRLKIGTANGSFVIHQKHPQPVQLEVEPPIFEPEKLAFRALKSERNYIIRQDEYTLFCGVAQFKSLYCLVFDWKKFQPDLHKVTNILQQHERFSAVPKVSFVDIEASQIRVSFTEQAAQQFSCYIASAVVAAAHFFRYDGSRQSVKVMLENEYVTVHSAAKARSVFIEGSAQWLFDGALPR